MKTHKITSVISAIIVFVLLNAVCCCAESLWSDTKKSAYEDKKASKVGDILTIVISETASSSQSASLDASKSNKLDSPKGIGPLLKEIPLFQFSNSNSTKGSGSTNRTSNLTATVTVKVTGVDENGNLKIEGSREVQTNSEKSTIKLTGTVRPEDVSESNTVLSSYVADAKIQYEGKGPIGDRQKEGIIQKILKFLF